MRMKKGNARHLVVAAIALGCIGEASSSSRAGHCYTTKLQTSPATVLLETIRGFLPCIKPIVSANPNLAGTLRIRRIGTLRQKLKKYIINEQKLAEKLFANFEKIWDSFGLNFV